MTTNAPLTPDPTCEILGTDRQQIPQEMRIMFGTLVLFRAIEEQMGCLDSCDEMSKAERYMLINLGVPRRMGQVAEALNTQPSAVTAVADALEARGLLARRRDPDDRRAWQLQLTPAGEAARRDLIETIVTLVRGTTGLDETEAAALAGLFDKVTAHILKSGYPKGLTL